MYYEKLWKEVCERMQWNSFNLAKAPVVGIHNEPINQMQTTLPNQASGEFGQVAN
jgi:hypothetical protein